MQISTQTLTNLTGSFTSIATRVAKGLTDTEAQLSLIEGVSSGRDESPDCRLWARFGKGWEWTRLKDVFRETLFSRVYRACKEWKAWTGRGEFLERMDFVRKMTISTIEIGWLVGYGPNCSPYAKCRDDFWVLP